MIFHNKIGEQFRVPFSDILVSKENAVPVAEPQGHPLI